MLKKKTLYMLQKTDGIKNKGVTTLLAVKYLFLNRNPFNWLINDDWVSLRDATILD